MLVAVGAVKIRHWSLAPLFFAFAAPSLGQARSAEGLIAAEVLERYGLQFSVTTWASPADMKTYALSGVHKRAVAVQPLLGINYGFHHFQTERPVTPDDAVALWCDAKEYRP